MEINKKIFITALLVLMLLGVIGTVSATDSLDNNLAAEDSDAVSVDMGDSSYNSLSSTNDYLLSGEETIIYVDGSYDGDEQGTEDNPYKTISAAASNATGGETIFIKNGEYNENTIKDLAKPLTFTGESQDGVIIKTDSAGFINTYKDYNTLVFNNLIFKEIACTGANAVMFIGGSGNVNITNCVFDSDSGRYGALRIYTSGAVVIDNCKFLNTKSTTGSYSSAIDFGGSSDSEYIVRNSIIDNSTIDSTTYIFGAIYSEKTGGLVTLDNVNITNCILNPSTSLIAAKGNMNIKNSKIMNNYVYRDLAIGGLFFISGGKTVTIETTIILNNTQPNNILSANSASASFNLSYNNIQNNTYVNDFANPNNPDIYTLDYNYWGSNDKPSYVNVNNWAIDDNGVFKLNDGSELAKEIPRLDDGKIGDENTTFVSKDGDDNNDGSIDSPVATIAKAVELAKNRSGEIIVEEGTYTENNIVLDSNVTISITGMGNVVIDGNASSDSIFILHGGQATFTNIRFTNNKPRYGGAIFVNYGTGTSRNVVDINVTVDRCTFENIESSSRGGSIYAWYTKGNLVVKDSHFINSTAGSWGGAICVGYSAVSDGLNVEITGSTFEYCVANNGGACYLQANTLNVTDSVFEYNNASYDSGAMQIYNSTAIIDNCKISNNRGGSQGVAIKETMPSKNTPRTLTITNSIIENNSGHSSTLPAIYVDMTTLYVSYSSLVNDLSIETRTATGYDAVYGQGIAIVNNNWWGTNDPSTKVTGTNITMDNWAIMNVEANVTEAIPGDKVALIVDFSSVNTTSGEIEPLTGGTIPKTHKVQLSVGSGTVVPATLTIKSGNQKTAVYTVANIDDILSVVSEEAVVNMSFVPAVPPYYGIIYVSKDGDDNNNGSEIAPVATIAKAIERASVVGGSGQIVITEGTYNGTDYMVTKNLTITGIGNVVMDAEGKGRFFNLPSDYAIDKFELNNLILTNSSNSHGSVIYNYAATDLILNNVTIVNNTEGISSLITTNGNLFISDSVISDNNAGKIVTVSGKYVSSAKYDVVIDNTTFENNVAPDYYIIDVSTSVGTLTLNLTDSHFINNTGKLGVINTNSKTVMNVKGTEFIDNTNNKSSGGAINAYKLNVENSSFINNHAVRNGGAIYVNYNGGDAVITKSTFINNTAGEKGNAIYNSNKLSIEYSVLLDDGTGYIIFHDGDDNVLEANYNWWGTNDDPKDLIGVGTYEDDWGDDVDCEFDASKWVVMNVANNLTSDTVNIDDQIEFAIDFNHYTDSTGDIKELEDSIPEVEVSASAINGELDKQNVLTENNLATFVYTAIAEGEDTITITSTNAINTTDINVKSPIVPDVIYVSVDGSDSNVGSLDAPVATIAHAIEITEKGKIVILEGSYTIDRTLVVDKDLDISGEGSVVIDGNQTRIIENTANLNLTNIAFTNARMAFGSAILDEGNVTINGCSFYGNMATATSSGNIINNRKGAMTINDSEFYENVASRGVVASQSATNLVINNSEFYDNDMTSLTTTYGIVYSTSADTVVENTVFRNNKAKQGAGIWASRSTYSDTGSLEVINCTFKNNIAQTGTGGAVFTSGSVTANIANSTFVNNSAIKSSLGVGGNGGAIYTTGTSSVEVVNSVFIDNSGDEDAGIYVGATSTSSSSLAISNSVILAKYGDSNFALNAADGAVVTAEDNFWGDNSKANTNANVGRWVMMNATYDNDTGILSVSFNSTNSTDGRIADYLEVLPDGFDVSVVSSTGKLDEILPVVAGQASTVYTLDDEDEFINVTCRNAEVIIPFIKKPDIIYVAMNGSDSNIGSIDAPVASIEHAVEIAEKGKIIILEGNYTSGDLGIISNDLNITGVGKVIIDAQNNNRILYVGEDANVILENLIMINGANADGSGALLGNSNSLTLINCTLANSSAGEHNGGAIYNVGKLTIINSTIANNTAKEGGAIFTNDALAKGPEIVIENSIISNNTATGKDNLGGGAIFSQQLAGLTITNTAFENNEALGNSSGGAIFISHSTASITIDDSEFIANHANGNDQVGGGAIYMVGTSNYERKGTLTISNTLFEDNTADTNGGAIYARATTVKVTNSVLVNNTDANGLAVYGYKTEQISPAITLNDNWWGTNDNPEDLVGGNSNYKPTLSRWVILTATNDTPIVEGSTVKITVSLDKYTDGEVNGTLSAPITIPRNVLIETTSETFKGELENGEFSIEYAVPSNLKLITATVDDETIIIFKAKTPTTLSVENITAEKGDAVNITVTVKSDEGVTVNAGEVEVYFDGDLVATIPVEDGMAIKEVVIDKDAGVYEILAEYTDLSGEFNSSKSNAVLNVTRKNDANLNITEISIDDFNNVNIAVEVDKGVVGNITFIISGDEQNYTDDVVIEDGSAVYMFVALDKGDYTVSVKFAGNEEYYPDSAEDSFSVNKGIPLLEVYVVVDEEGSVSIYATLDSDASGNVTFIVLDSNNETFIQFDAEIIDGVANEGEKYKDFDLGNWTVIAKYAGNDDFIAGEDNVTFDITKQQSNLVVDDIVIDDDKQVTITAKVDENVEGDVTFTVSGGESNYTGVVPIEEGSAIYKVPVALDNGNYTVSVTYGGNNETYAAHAESEFSVADKTATKLIIPNRVIYVNDAIGGYIYQIILKDENGNPLGNEEVSFTVNGITKTSITGSDGWAEFNFTANAEGVYTIEVSYAGNKEYKAISQNGTITLVKEQTKFVAPDRAVYVKELSNGYTYQAILKSKDGKVLANKKVLAIFSGKKYFAVTDDKGWATFKIFANKEGTYKLTIRFLGDRCYKGVEEYRTIKAIKEPTSLSVKISTFNAKDKTKQVSATLQSKSGSVVSNAKVTLKVNGATYTGTTNSNGVALIKISLTQLGIFNASWQFSETNLYGTSTATSKIVIK